jgi:hypothetical protein
MMPQLERVAVAAGFLVVGLSMVTIGPNQRDGVSSVVIGTFVLLLSVW